MPFMSANVPISTLNIKVDTGLLLQILHQLIGMANLRVMEKVISQKHPSQSIFQQ